MKKALLTILVVLCFTVGGCAWLESTFPSRTGITGEPIPGTHDAIPPVKDVAATIPYADVAIGILLLVWNAYERNRGNSLNKGLKSTVQTIENAGEDPLMAEVIAKLKTQLSQAHQVAGAQPVVQDILAKL